MKQISVNKRKIRSVLKCLKDTSFFERKKAYYKNNFSRNKNTY